MFIEPVLRETEDAEAYATHHPCPWQESTWWGGGDRVQKGGLWQSWPCPRTSWKDPVELVPELGSWEEGSRCAEVTWLQGSQASGLAGQD